MELYEHLRHLRREKHMTQAEVAERLHMTRQAVSGYELGRTQPDVETLKRLADIYGVALQELLEPETAVYGSGGRALHLLRGTETVLLLCCAARAGLFLIVNHGFVVPEGMVSQEIMPVLEKRMALLEAAFLLERLLLLGGWWLGAVLLMQSLRSLRTAKQLWLEVAVLTAAMLLLTLLGAAADPVYGFGNYFHISGLVMLRAVLLLLLGTVGRRICRK